MSSENFESLEEDYVDMKNELLKKIDKDLLKAVGENRKNMLRSLQREMDEIQRVLLQMENEMKFAPNPYRLQMNTRLKQYQQELVQMKKRVGEPSVFSARNDLFDRPTSQQKNISGGGDAANRNRLLQMNNTLEKTSESVLRSQQVAEETDQVGVAVIDELNTQRESLIRTKERLVDTDDNLTRSRKILRTMYRKVVTNKVILIGIILLECVILGAVVYMKFFKK